MAQKIARFWIVFLILGVMLAACGTTSPTISTNTPTTSISTPTASATAKATVTTVPTSAPASATPSPNNTATIALDANRLKSEVQPLLAQLWQSYKDRYIQQDGRVKDPQRADASTSEGQSYDLLRAFWQNDRNTFDRVLQWSINNLQLPRGDKLFAYLWGNDGKNNWKVLDPAVATDADQDIAFALIMATQRWNEPRYQAQAQQILNDMWDKTVINIKGQPYLTAGDWSPALARPVLNPSYFAPYQYRLFARIDKNHNWAALVDTSYSVIKGCTQSKLDAAEGKLPPNWCSIDKQSGAFGSALDQDKSFDSNYGYDAFRTVWRLALDYQWYGEQRALDYLKSLDLLRNEWKTNRKLDVIYDHAGRPKDTAEDLGIYAAGGVPLFMLTEPQLAHEVVKTKLLPGLAGLGKDDPDPAHIDASKARTYYSQNWVWFGLAMYVEALPAVK